MGAGLTQLSFILDATIGCSDFIKSDNVRLPSGTENLEYQCGNLNTFPSTP